jgi:two-component system LytT family sensor kinase
MPGFKQVNYKRILRHLLFWLAFIMYQAIHEGWDTRNTLSFNLAPEFLTDIPIAILLTYINLYVLMPLYYYNQKYVHYFMALVVLLVSVGFVERFVTYILWIPWDRLHDPAMYKTENKNFWQPLCIVQDIVEAYPLVAVTTLFKLMRNSYQSEKRLREIEKEKFSAELGLLKAQINPHFFFNTLNSLYALNLKGSEQASKVVLRLSELMHYMLYETSANKVPLKNDIKHLENYISIEQMRFADRLDLSFQYSGDIDGKMIAPLLLLPFVENAFKHGIEDNAGWITIDLKVSGNKLFLKVENSCSPPLKVKSKGLGLSNVKRRLELTYPDQYELRINQNNETFDVELKLDL